MALLEKCSIQNIDQDLFGQGNIKKSGWEGGILEMGEGGKMKLCLGG